MSDRIAELARQAKRHDHRQSLWLIAGGAIAWCYQCGAWTMNAQSDKRNKWHRPTGIGGPNPALAEEWAQGAER